jgi:hypothetical protein
MSATGGTYQTYTPTPNRFRLRLWQWGKSQQWQSHITKITLPTLPVHNVLSKGDGYYTTNNPYIISKGDRHTTHTQSDAVKHPRNYPTFFPTPQANLHCPTHCIQNVPNRHP